MTWSMLIYVAELDFDQGLLWVRLRADCGNTPDANVMIGQATLDLVSGALFVPERPLCI
jgi:hypothetical protein